jgi:hypothetical protein
MSAVPVAEGEPDFPRMLRLLGAARTWLPYIAIVVGLVLLWATTALAAATLALGVVLLFFQRFAIAMGGLAASPSSPDIQLVGTAMRAETAGLVTLQGVVLGLVFSFLGDHAVTPAVGVAAVALVCGVLLGLLLLSLIAFGIQDHRQAHVAAHLFILSLSSAAYGLLCIAAATVFER